MRTTALRKYETRDEIRCPPVYTGGYRHYVPCRTFERGLCPLSSEHAGGGRPRSQDGVNS